MWITVLSWLVPVLASAGPLLGLGVWSLKQRNKEAEALEGNSGAAAIEAGSGSNSPTPGAAAAAVARASAQKLRGEAESFQESVATLERRALENSAHNIYGYLNGLVGELHALGHKLKTDSFEQRARMTYIKYTDLLSKIIEITSEGYYGSFVKDPDHWNNPQRMRVQVEAAVLAVAKEAAGDIKLLNADKTLNFKVSVESLVGQSGSLEEDGDEQLKDLLASATDTVDIYGDLNTLEEEVSAEAKALLDRQAEEERERIVREEKAALEAKFKAGSADSLKHAAVTAERKRVLLKERYKQSFEIFEARSSKEKVLALHSNSITGAKDWKDFKSIYDAALWIDGLIRDLEKKHDFRCECVYCQEDN